MLERIIEKVDKLIEKYHKCENWMEISNMTLYKSGKTEITYKCEICGNTRKELK